MAIGQRIRTARVGASLVALAFAVQVLPGMPAPAKAQGETASPGTARTITVDGQGEASARPDEAVLTFAVMRQGGTAKAAVDEASAAMEDVLAGMRELGASDRDLQTAYFQISPRYRQNDGAASDTNAIVGYDARNALTVTVRDIQKVGSFLDKAVSLGVNEGGDIRFTLSDDTDLMAEARRNAVDDARSKAELLTGAAGVTLGDLVSISEPGDDGNQPPMPMMRMAAESASSVPIEAGELTRTATIRMVYAIAP